MNVYFLKTVFTYCSIKLPALYSVFLEIVLPAQKPTSKIKKKTFTVCLETDPSVMGFGFWRSCAYLPFLYTKNSFVFSFLCFLRHNSGTVIKKT